MTLQQLVKKLKEIKESGFVYTHRLSDTGIGKTLEDMLGISENNLRMPDVGDVELKAKRIDSGAMLTIASKSPEPRGVNRRLFENYKYLDDQEYYNLHSTVYGSKRNPQGFKVVLKNDRLILENKNNIEAYWPKSIFDDVLKSKSNKILLVFAETKGDRNTKNEQFHYVEGFLLSNLNPTKFAAAIRNDKLKIDIRIGVFRSGSRKGKYHDHGTGFRINRRDFLELFDNYDQLI